MASTAPPLLSLPAPDPKKPPPGPWSHLETVHLIESYQEKWYSLKRGQLKASQWEEVSVAVAARCGFDEPSKTATQCRHKIEKLRKRYRAEKQRPPSLASAWPYFHLMDLLERGPLPISALRPIDNHRSDSSNDEDDDDDDGGDGNGNGGNGGNGGDGDEEISNTRSINYILRRPAAAAGVAGVGNFKQPPVFVDRSSPLERETLGFSKFSRNPRFRKRKLFEEKEEGRVVEDPISGLASVVRSLGEGFVKIENMKMEMMREMEHNWMEMEKKRTEMILESQHRIAEVIAKAFCSQKKAKKSQEM